MSRRLLWSFDTKEPEDYLSYLKDLSGTFSPLNKDLENNLDLKYKQILKLDCSREFNKSKYGMDSK